MTTMGDTRDIVLELRGEFREFKSDMTDKVNRNSEILQELHEAHVEARGRSKLLRASLAAVKALPYGAIGAGCMWLLQHIPAPR